MWFQHYDPLGNALLSTLVAALPIFILLGSIAFLRVRIHFAALAALAMALFVAIGVYHMPARAAGAAVAYGAAYGLLPIGWIVLNLIFLYALTVRRGLFQVLQASLARVTPDPHIQLILIAFCFGAFFEGAAGFGTPVAISAAILAGLGFTPLHACALSLIANTAPVAFGALGTPLIALAGVTGLELHALSAMAGRQLPFFSLIVPFWLVWAYAGLRGALAVWPAALAAGVGFALPQFLVSNFHGPWLVDIVASVCSMGTVLILLRFWEPSATRKDTESADPSYAADRRTLRRAWLPWIILSCLVFLWGLPAVKHSLDQMSAPAIEVNGLHGEVARSYPVAAKPRPGQPIYAEEAVYRLNWLSATGTGILAASLIAALALRFRPREILAEYFATLLRVRYSLLTIAAMLALGFLTRYSGLDATLGLALARTGAFYPFFGTLLGWLGVALTGSDTASNVLFGSLQKITAEQTGVSPVLMCAANSSGGVMGKMIDAQSIVVASTATQWYGHEGAILRYVFFHSLALAVLVGLLVHLQATVWPFTGMVVGGSR
ncbi:MAG: L-lactate permease [Gammaproteobacteria bacterium]|nr:L-lactate permease [Gammaproteobacteria bacterium]